MKKPQKIPVVDIFAGPGGLGEGFMAFEAASGTRPFSIKLSIEMDEFAHRTLLLRSFVRQFEPGRAPSAYYEYLRGEGKWSGVPLEALIEAFPAEGAHAQREAWRAELRPEIADEVDERILAALGPKRGRPPWVLVGGPPCQAYSLVGRARMLGERGDRFYADKRHTLYREYLRLLAAHGPCVFIMENVKGLLSATSRGGSLVFEQIVRDLRSPPGSTHRYRLFSIASSGHSSEQLFVDGDDPRNFIVECERHGVPQARHRLIILGVLESEFGHGLQLPRRIVPAAEAVTCGSVLAGLPKLRSGLSREADSAERWTSAVSSAATAPWFAQLSGIGQADVAGVVARAVEQLTAPRAGKGSRFTEHEGRPGFRADWFSDSRLGGVCNHEARTHRADDLHRYLFVSCFGKVRRISPRLGDFPAKLLPNHANVADALDGGMFNDRFRVQLAGAPATTITSHISKDGHYFIHPDPVQCRSLTVREAARIQTFPDNYFFEGPRTEQYRQVGNAVPPLLAHQIAGIVADGIRAGWK
jgi:DNA (cytosine-5)-methyltransferase 1